MPQLGVLSKHSPNPPLQRTRFALRDRGFFRRSFRTEFSFAPNSAPLNGNPLARRPSTLIPVHCWLYDKMFSVIRIFRLLCSGDGELQASILLLPCLVRLLQIDFHIKTVAYCSEDFFDATY
jgi:hypothetical protein